MPFIAHLLACSYLSRTSRGLGHVSITSSVQLTIMMFYGIPRQSKTLNTVMSKGTGELA